MSIGAIFNTSISGMNAAKVGVSMSSHNISNMNTDGYTRQMVHFGTNFPQKYSNAGYIGTGVNVSNIERIKDMYLESQIRGESSKLSEHTAMNGVLENVETYFKEPSDTGLNAAMTDWFTAWDQLGNDPTNSALKEVVKEKSISLAEQLNTMTSQINDVRQNADDLITGDVQKMQDSLTQLDQLNQKIHYYYKEHKVVPNDMLDMRDQIVNEITTQAKIDVNYNEDGTVDINVPLSDGTSARVTQPNDPADLTPVVTVDSIKDKITSGSIKGLHDAKNEVDKFIANFDTLKNGVVNGINGTYNPSATPGNDFFAIDASGNVSVVVGTVDGTNAKDVGKLRDGDVIGTDSLQEHYAAMLVGMGSVKQANDKQVDSQTALLKQLDMKRDSISGVSLDEETANLVKFQSAYAANAQVVTVVTDMFDTLIGMMR